MSKKDKVNKPSGKVKKTVLTVLLVILIVLLIVAAVVGIKFRSHIKAAIIWLTTSDEDIQKNIDKAKEQQTEVLTNSGFNASKELDEALTSGLISAEEHTQILLGNITLEEILQNNSETDETDDELQNSDETEQDVTGQDDANQNDTDEADETQDETVDETNRDESNSEKTEKPVKEEKDNPDKTDAKNDSSDKKNNKPSASKDTAGKNPAKKEETSAPAKTDTTKNEASKSDTSAVTTPKPSTGQNTDSAEVDKRIAEIVTRMYVLKAEYTGAIDGIVSSMKAEYVKLPVEQRNRSAKQSIAARYVGQINSMEIQCDAQVNSIVAELRTLLKNNGRDTALADAIMSTYASEKENTKAYYLSTYGD